MSFRRAGTLAVFLLCAGLGSALFHHEARGQDSLQVGSRVPASLLQRLRDGGANQPLVIAFWASWCEPCREELPALVALQERYGSRLRVVSISIDQARPAALRTLRARDVRLPVVVDEGLAERFGAGSRIPSTFFIGAAGRVRYAQRGFQGGLDGLEAAIAAALGPET